MNQQSNMSSKVVVITLFISLPCLSFGMQQWSQVHRARARNTEVRSVATGGDINRLRQFLARENVNAQDAKGWTLLHYAAEHGLLNVVEELLVQKGILVNAQNDDDQTPLHRAALNGHVDVAELLLRHGAQVDAPTDGGSTPLHYAVRRRHSKIIALLLQNDAVVDARNFMGHTPLYEADNCWEATELLVQNGASLYDPDADGRTPFHWQTWTGYGHTVDVFLDAFMAQAQNEPGSFSTDQSLPDNPNGHGPPPIKRARKVDRHP